MSKKIIKYHHHHYHYHRPNPAPHHHYPYHHPTLHSNIYIWSKMVKS